MNKSLISSIADECLKDMKFDEGEDFGLDTIDEKDLEGYGVLDWFEKLKNWNMVR